MHPYYAKADTQGCDENMLNAFTGNQIKLPYISAKSHGTGVFTLLFKKLAYKSFKPAEGKSASRIYNKALGYSPVIEKYIAYSFSHHSAGPVGSDIDGEWMAKSTLLKILAIQGLDWKDIHASTEDSPTASF